MAFACSVHSSRIQQPSPSRYSRPRASMTRSAVMPCRCPARRSPLTHRRRVPVLPRGRPEHPTVGVDLDDHIAGTSTSRPSDLPAANTNAANGSRSGVRCGATTSTTIRSASANLETADSIRHTQRLRAVDRRCTNDIFRTERGGPHAPVERDRRQFMTANMFRSLLDEHPSVPRPTRCPVPDTPRCPSHRWPTSGSTPCHTRATGRTEARSSSLNRTQCRARSEHPTGPPAPIAPSVGPREPARSHRSLCRSRSCAWN